MRPIPLFAAVILAAVGPAAIAQAATAPVPAPEVAPLAPGADVPAPPIDTTPSTSSAELEAFNTRIQADEATLTRLRDVELARGNAVIRAVKPALPFRTYWYFVKIPHEDMRTRNGVSFPSVHLPRL